MNNKNQTSACLLHVFIHPQTGKIAAGYWKRINRRIVFNAIQVFSDLETAEHFCHECNKHAKRPNDYIDHDDDRESVLPARTDQKQEAKSLPSSQAKEMTPAQIMELAEKLVKKSRLLH